MIDYQQAAERLLVALSFIGGRLPDRPVPAVQLCSHTFPLESRKHWSHETKRRRVREAVVFARQRIAARQEALIIAANGEGYWITGDAGVMAWYAQRRRRRGLTDLAAGGQAKRAVAAVDQDRLFEEPPAPMRH